MKPQIIVADIDSAGIVVPRGGSVLPHDCTVLISVTSSPELTLHAPMSAYERDTNSPVWDMSQERVFIETLLNQRFNFFLIFFGLVIAASVNTKTELQLKLLTTLGALLAIPFLLLLQRSQRKLDLIIDDLKTDLTHPVRVIDDLANMTTRSRRRLVGVVIPTACFVVLAAAAAAAWLGWLPVPSATPQQSPSPVIRSRLGHASKSPEASAWLFDGPMPVKGSITYSSDAMFESDIPLPEIQEINASVKLIQSPSPGAASERVVAYRAKIRVAGLQKKDIPAKYLREVVEQHKGGPTTTLPLEQVTYVAQLQFDLLDRDGFTLAEVTGPDEWLQSGITNVFQRVTTTHISQAVANRVAKIRPHIFVVRCESCRAT